MRLRTIISNVPLIWLFLSRWLQVHAGRLQTSLTCWNGLTWLGYRWLNALEMLTVSGHGLGDPLSMAWQVDTATALLGRPTQHRPSSSKLGDIAAIFGLSYRQSALLEHLIDNGGLREAAARTGITYLSARNALAEIKQKIGLETIPLIVAQVLALSEEAAASTRELHDLFSLTERQFAVARGLAVRKSRQEIARSVGISEAVVDAETKNIYLTLGVNTAVAAIRMVETGMASARGLPAHRTTTDGHTLPLGVVTLAGRTIGYSDFGPTSGRPVVILHSTITARAPPTRLVAALMARGFRPIAVDRPGFGDTDSADDHFGCAASDLAGVCSHLGIERVDLIARGSGQAAVAIAAYLPSLVDRVILVNPTPAIAHTPNDRGPLGRIKRRFASHPAMIDLTIRTLARFVTASRLQDGMIRSFRDSPPDLALAEQDPQFIADYLRATRDFGRGRVEGYVREQKDWATGFDVPVMTGCQSWCILQASQFVLHDPEPALAYWRARLPHTPVRMIDAAGQMLAYSHPDAIVDILSGN